MVARLVTMLAMLAIAVVTTATYAHAARLRGVPDHAAHIGVTMPAPDGSAASCDGERPCGSTDAGMCEVACAGFLVFLTWPSADTGPDSAPVGHDRPAGSILASRAPGLNDRPPQPRLS